MQMIWLMLGYYDRIKVVERPLIDVYTKFVKLYRTFEGVKLYNEKLICGNC